MTAKDMAQKEVSAALVLALSPICVDKFQDGADAAANLLELKKVSSWQQSSFIEKGGWARSPAASRPMRPLPRPAPRCSAAFKVILLTPPTVIVERRLDYADASATPIVDVHLVHRW
jgi:hypothetical protein